MLGAVGKSHATLIVCTFAENRSAALLKAPLLESPGQAVCCGVSVGPSTAMPVTVTRKVSTFAPAPADVPGRYRFVTNVPLPFHGVPSGATVFTNAASGSPTIWSSVMRGSSDEYGS